MPSSEVEVVRAPGMIYRKCKATRIRSRLFTTARFIEPELKANILDYCDDLDDPNIEVR